jgi:hypothetical protein
MADDWDKVIDELDSAEAAAGRARIAEHKAELEGIVGEVDARQDGLARKADPVLLDILWPPGGEG